MTYKEKDLVKIKKTQFATDSKWLRPYKVVKVKRQERYDLEKIGDDAVSKVEFTSADHMKMWTNEDDYECSTDVYRPCLGRCMVYALFKKR